MSHGQQGATGPVGGGNWARDRLVPMMISGKNFLKNKNSFGVYVVISLDVYLGMYC